MAVLDGAGQVGVARSRPRHGCPVRAGRALGHRRLDVHRLLPVDPVAVPDQQRDRRAGRVAAPHAGQDLRTVALDLHPAAAAIAALAALELSVERVDVEREARRQAVHGDDERLAVRLTSGEKSEHLRSILYEETARSRGRRGGWRSLARRHGACTDAATCSIASRSRRARSTSPHMPRAPTTLAARGRHAAAERELRELAGALARRRASRDAAAVLVRLGRLLSERGRALAAVRAFEAASALADDAKRRGPGRRGARLARHLEDRHAATGGSRGALSRGEPRVCRRGRARPLGGGGAGACVAVAGPKRRGTSARGRRADPAGDRRAIGLYRGYGRAGASGGRGRVCSRPTAARGPHRGLDADRPADAGDHGRRAAALPLRGRRSVRRRAGVRRRTGAGQGRAGALARSARRLAVGRRAAARGPAGAGRSRTGQDAPAGPRGAAAAAPSTGRGRADASRRVSRHPRAGARGAAGDPGRRLPKRGRGRRVDGCGRASARRARGPSHRRVGGGSHGTGDGG